MRWFTTLGHRIIYTVDRSLAHLVETIGDPTEIVSTGPTIDYGRVLDDLGQRGVETLMVEGGQLVHTTLLAGGTSGFLFGNSSKIFTALDPGFQGVASGGVLDGETTMTIGNHTHEHGNRQGGVGA